MKLDRLDALGIDRSGAAAAGGWTEGAEIWVAGRGRARDWGVGGGMRGAWIEGNVGLRINAIHLEQFAFVFPFVVVLVFQIVGLRIGGSRESPRCGSRPPTTGFRRSCGDRGSCVGACRRHHFANLRGRIAISGGMLYELKTNSIRDEGVHAVVRWFFGCVVAHHALLGAVFTTVMPIRHVVVE